MCKCSFTARSRLGVTLSENERGKAQTGLAETATDILARIVCTHCNSFTRWETLQFVSYLHSPNVSRSSCIYELAKAQVPKSRFSAGACGEMSKLKMSIGRPMVVHEFGMSTIPATCP